MQGVSWVVCFGMTYAYYYYWCIDLDVNFNILGKVSFVFAQALSKAAVREGLNAYNRGSTQDMSINTFWRPEPSCWLPSLRSIVGKLMETNGLVEVQDFEMPLNIMKGLNDGLYVSRCVGLSYQGRCFMLPSVDQGCKRSIRKDCTLMMVVRAPP